MQYETNKDKGRIGLTFGIAWFTANGYTISIPLNDTQWYDFIAEKNGKFYTVQCKTTGGSRNAITLDSYGGTDGSRYDNVLNHPLDFLFCMDKEQNMFVIPMEDLRKAGNIKSITLRAKPRKNTANNVKIESVKYLVNLS